MNSVNNVVRSGRVMVLFMGLATNAVAALLALLEGMVGVDDSLYEGARKERGA